MKIKIIISLVVLVLLVVSNGYGAVLRGRVTLQNSGFQLIKRVQVKALGEKANPTTITDSGEFELVIDDRNPGEVVLLDIYKEGYEIVNPESLRVTLPDDPEEKVNIAMCKTGERARNALKFYGIAEKEVYKIFTEKIAKVNAEAIKGKDIEIRRLTEERDAALAQAKRMSEEFAQVNLDEASDLYKEAFGYFTKGDIDKAYEVLSDIKIDLDLQNARKLKEKADSAIKQSSANYVFKAQLAILKFRFVEAEGYYDKALEADPENLDNYIEFSEFLWNQKNSQKGTEICQKALAIKMDEGLKAWFLTDLGNLYADTTRLTEAEKVYTEALISWRKLVATNPAAYLPNVAMTLNNLGNLYYKTTRLTEAEKAYAEALIFWSKLAAINPTTYLDDMAMTLNNLGLLYTDTTRSTGAEKAYAEALAIYRKLAATNPAAYSSFVANILNNLGILYKNTMRFKEAEKAYAEALMIYRRLAATNPAAYLSDVAMTLNNLGILYMINMQLTDAEKILAEALEVRRKLAATNPAAYLPDVSMTLNNLGILYSDTTRLKEAEKVYVESLRFYRQLAATNPAAYSSFVATTLNNLGNLYSDTARLTEAEKAYTEALEIRRQLAATNPATYLSVVATTLNNLGSLNVDMKKYSDALLQFLEALNIRKKLAAANPQAFDLGLCKTILSMTLLYTEAPDACAEIKGEIPSLLNRAITILKKYPDYPQAQKYLNMAEQLKTKIK